MHIAPRILATISACLVAAHFGLFLAWVCTTMWGLDAADPRVAMAAMQAMNASVRNVVFAPVFFGAPVALLITAAVLRRSAGAGSARLLAAAGVVVLLGSVFATMTVNVPMNEALAGVAVPDDITAAQDIWVDYSPTWQFWNQFRTVAAGIGTVLALVALQRLPHRVV